AEAALGVRLFDRVEGAWRPTAAGASAAAAAERMEGEAGALAEAVAGADARVAGTVRLTAVPLLVDRLLVPALPALLARHPDLTVELVAEPRALSLTRREADLALRLARPTGEQAPLARRIGRLAYAAYGPTGADASALPWIGYDDSMADLPPARRMMELAARDGRPMAGLRVNDGGGLLQAIRAGIGRGLLPRLVGDRAAGLARLDDPDAVLERELWLMIHPELRGLARVRAVVAWLDAVFGDG
ncbi:LysR family transcriptional regulator, partial [Thalassobaculum sp.]|uniref:LysR family transcriptional regulator n=1 Tax=Thalassobaculum sp. TaxID=2022740 RepID=UPI0032EF38FE